MVRDARISRWPQSSFPAGDSRCARRASTAGSKRDASSRALQRQTSQRRTVREAVSPWLADYVASLLFGGDGAPPSTASLPVGRARERVQQWKSFQNKRSDGELRFALWRRRSNALHGEPAGGGLGRGSNNRSRFHIRKGRPTLRSLTFSQGRGTLRRSVPHRRQRSTAFHLPMASPRPVILSPVERRRVWDGGTRRALTPRPSNAQTNSAAALISQNLRSPGGTTLQF